MLKTLMCTVLAAVFCVGFVVACVAGLDAAANSQLHMLVPVIENPPPPVAALIITATPGVVTPTVRAIRQVGYEPVVIAATVSEGYENLPDGQRVYVHGAIPCGDTIFTDRADLRRTATRNGFY